MENYDIIKKIGEGTFSKVYLARHIITNMNVALKAISKHRLLHKRDRMMIQKEIAILKDTSHENVCQMYQLFEDREFIYIVIEYMEKDNLLNYLKMQNKEQELNLFENSDEPSEAEIQGKKLEMFIDAVRGIRYLHKKRIVHRDIKLANILIDDQDRLKLADFGLSSYYSQSNIMKTCCGSPCFAAPEILMGKLYDPEKIDVWSLGVVFYCMLAGTLPFYDQNIKVIYEKVCAGKYTCPSSISPKFVAIIGRMLEMKPENRIGLQELYQRLTVLRLEYKITNKKFNSRKIIYPPEFTKKIKEKAYTLSKDYYEHLDEIIFEKYFVRESASAVFGPMNTTIRLFIKKAKKQVEQEEKAAVLNDKKLMLYQSLRQARLKKKNSDQKSIGILSSTESELKGEQLQILSITHKNKQHQRIQNKEKHGLNKQRNREEDKVRTLKRNTSLTQKNNQLIKNQTESKHLKRSMHVGENTRRLQRLSSPHKGPGNCSDNERYIRMCKVFSKSQLGSEDTKISRKNSSYIEEGSLGMDSKLEPSRESREQKMRNLDMLQISKSQQKLSFIKTLKYVPFSKKISNEIPCRK